MQAIFNKWVHKALESFTDQERKTIKRYSCFDRTNKDIGMLIKII